VTETLEVAGAASDLGVHGDEVLAPWMLATEL
jgi:hypothetical protein